jgi:hypothetical protein
VKGTHFEDFVNSRKRRDVDVAIEVLSANALHRVTQLLVFEQLSGTIVPLGNEPALTSLRAQGILGIFQIRNL